jgi:anti-sigma regulatory factor (Ser/Thr protein kinase)
VALDDGFRHEAFLYADEGEFLAGTLAFIRGALAEGQPILVVVDAAKIATLLALLDGDAEKVQFTDARSVGPNPARIIPLWRAFVDQHGGVGRRLRGVSELNLAGRSRDVLVEWRHHEALLNEALADAAGFWLLAPFDAAGLDPLLIGQAHGAEARALPQAPLGEPPAGVDVHEFGVDDLPGMRRIAERHAVSAALADRIADVALVVDELASNSVRHGGGRGVLRLWRQGRTLICEVSDRGHVADPLVGLRRPVDGQVGGRGLWVVNQICDLLQVRSSPSGTTVRAHISPNGGG